MDRPERDQKVRFAQSLRLVTVLLVPFLLSSCAGLPRAQGRVRAAAESGDYAGASRLLEEHRKDYGRRADFLYLLEKGYLEHVRGLYRESIESFERARRRYDELYTRSISGFAASFVFTDYSMDYRGEDFERILINVFQALNYVMLGEYDEARVEARDADSKLAVINSHYPEGQKNVYREDAFCRLLMGLLYEASPHPQDADDACLWFRQALTTYEKDYRSNYGTNPPAFLEGKARQCPPAKPPDQRPAEVYVIQYEGFSPVKEEVMVPVPLLNGYITQIAFPEYRYHSGSGIAPEIVARDEKGKTFSAKAECAEDIAAIAVKNLEDRKVRTVAKAAAKAGAKYAILKNQENSAAKRGGSAGVDLFKIFSSIYFMSTNRADLRSWQTLPARVMITRLELEPGLYWLRCQAPNGAGNGCQVDLGTARLKPAEKKFFIVRVPS